MKIKMVTHGEGRGHSNPPVMVDLEAALEELQKSPPHNPSPDWRNVSEINFLSPWNGLQLLQDEEKVWRLLLLYRENNLSDYECSDRDFTTAEVEEIVSAFFMGGNWEKLCGVYKLSPASRILYRFPFLSYIIAILQRKWEESKIK